MKRFLQWFIALLQILFGLAFIAVIGLYIFDMFDVGRLKSDEYLKYVAYGCAGLYVLLSAVVMAVVLKQRGKARFYTVNEGGGVDARAPFGKVKKLLKKAAASVEGVSLKKFAIEAGTAGYTLKLMICVTGRSAKTAADELKGVAARLCKEVYGLTFADTKVIVAKVKNEADAREAVKETQAEMAASAAPQAEPEFPETAPQAESAPYDYQAPAPELETPRAEPEYSAPAETATVYTPEPESSVPEPIIKTAAAPKSGTAATKTRAKAGAPAAKKSGTKAKAPAKQKADPNDPPPFKL